MTTTIMTSKGPREMTAVEIAAREADAQAYAKAALPRAIAATKEEAQRRIYARLPQWKQANYLARMQELSEIVAGTHPMISQRKLTSEDVAQRTFLAAEWEWAKSVRAASDTLEAEVSALSTASEIDAWVWAMPGDARWPA